MAAAAYWKNRADERMKEFTTGDLHFTMTRVLTEHRYSEIQNVAALQDRHAALLFQ